MKKKKNKENRPEDKKEYFTKNQEQDKISFAFLSYKDKINPEEDLVPIRISYDNREYYADISTIRYLNKRMISYSLTQENGKIPFFKDRDMIIVRRITKEEIQGVLEEIVQYGDIDSLTKIHTI